MLMTQMSKSLRVFQAFKISRLSRDFDAVRQSMKRILISSSRFSNEEFPQKKNIGKNESVYV